MKLETNWQSIRRLFAQVFRSSLHYSMATVTSEGLPHVTPVGSLILLEPGRAIYFEEFTHRMPLNFRDNQHVCVLAVRSGLAFWFWSLLRGGFHTPPAIRLHGTVGIPRPATEAEIQLWLRRVGTFRFTRGYRLMWAGMRTVREVTFTHGDEIQIGRMTRECWKRFDSAGASAPSAR
jgi:hypothetical protein